MGVGSIANTGLKAAMTNMETISNNIANANTAGFKKSNVNFSDLYTSGFAGTRQVGFGVRVQSIDQDFSLGRIELTDRGLDLSLNNDGFFVQKNPSGQVSYTRAGDLQMDKDGYIIGGSGRLQGYPAINGVITASGVLGDLQVAQNSIAAMPSSLITMGLNLDAAAVPPSAAFSAADPTTFNYRSDTTVFDSLGKPYELSIYYVKTADNTWSTQVLMDNQNIGSGSIVFQSNGAIDTVSGMSGLSFSPNSGATSPQTFSMAYGNTTQYAGDSKTIKNEQDGFPAGKPTGFNIDGDGVINVYYTNGIAQKQGQIAVAQFAAPQGLARTDNMSWLATTQSGDPILSPDASKNAIASGTLELSNVDLTEELVKLMGAQHDFQANAQVAQTYNQLLQTIEKI